MIVDHSGFMCLRLIFGKGIKYYRLKAETKICSELEGLVSIIVVPEKYILNAVFCPGRERPQKKAALTEMA